MAQNSSTQEDLRETQALLSELVGMPTVSHRPMVELAALLAQRAEDLGMDVEWQEDESHPGKTNLICTAGPVSEGGEGLSLSGHMDVVPTEGQPWSSDPFTLTERDGRLYGRGSADMKGFLACTLQALQGLRMRELTRPLVLIWTCDEEIGCLGSRRLLPHLRGRPLPREVLIGEPTSFEIFRMHPGHVAVELRVQGASAHSSKPDLGANAILAMGRVLRELEDLQAELALETRWEGELDRPYVVMNPAQIQGGQAINLVPDDCALQLGYRPLPGDSPEALAERIRERLLELSLPGGITWSLEILRVTPSLLTEADTALERALRPMARSPRPRAASFATDGGNLSALGMDCLVYGPGSIDVAHKADEYISQSDLAEGVRQIRQLVRQRCL